MMFQTTGSYFQDRLAEPGGLNEYVTEFLSLAFIHPYGASVVIALLLGLISGCFFLYLKACGVRASMLAAILPSFLIWIYPQESIALLTMLAFVQVLAYLYTFWSSHYRYRLGRFATVDRHAYGLYSSDAGSFFQQTSMPSRISDT